MHGSTKGGNNLKSKEILEVVIKAADDKLAEDIIAMDVKDLTILSDYFVITNGKSERQMKSIVDGIVEAAAKNNISVKNVEGKDSGKWTLIDLNYVIVHVFSSDERSHYNLEKLWSDAPLVDIAHLVSEQ